MIGGVTIVAVSFGLATMLIFAKLLHELSHEEAADCPVCGAAVDREAFALHCHACGWHDFGP